MENIIEKITPLLVVFALMIPGMIAAGVYDSLKNTKTAVTSAVLAAPLTILIFWMFFSTQASEINGIGVLINGVLGVPIMYLLFAPTFYLLLTGIYYLYIRYWD